MTSDLERIGLSRAVEQCAGERVKGYKECDSWEVEAERRPVDLPRRTCRALGCDLASMYYGYCERHASKVSNGICLDLDGIEQAYENRRRKLVKRKALKAAAK